MNILKILFIFILFSYLYSEIDYAENGADDPSYKKGLQFYTEKKFLLAIGSFKKAVDSGLQDPKLYFYLANSYIATEDYDKAIDLYKLDLEMSDLPEFKAIVNFDLAYAYYLKKEYLKAIDLLNIAYGLNGNLNQTYWIKGNAFYLLKDKTNTINEWEKYIERVPNGEESDNIKKALAILKSPNYDMNKDKFIISLNGNGSNMTESAQESDKSEAINIQPLIDIQGVLDEIKPSDKGKLADEGMEEIEK